MQRIFVVENEHEQRASICRTLQRDADFAVEAMGGLKDAIERLDRQQPSLIVSKLNLPDGSGLDLLPALADREFDAPVIFMADRLSQYPTPPVGADNVEVMQTPLDHGDLAQRVMRHLDTPPVRPKPAQPFSVADYVQLAGMARRSVELTVKDRAGQSGRIIIQDGQTIWAQDSRGEGVDAFGRMVMTHEAEVECRPLESLPGPPNLSGSVDELLLEAARQADEVRRDVSPSVSVAARVPSVPPSSRPPREVPVPGAGMGNAAGSRTAISAPPLQAPPPVGVVAQGGIGAPVSNRQAASSIPRPRRPSLFPQIASSSRPPPLPGGGAPFADNSVQNLLGLAPSLKAAARAAADGSVMERAGEMDAETACAVVALAARQVDEVAAELGLGDPASWYITIGDATWYVVNDGFDILVAVGESSKNPGSVLQKIAPEGQS